MTDYKKLDNQPLKLVLAEFRFSQVLQIDQFIPKLQEELRKQYPTLKTSTEQSINVQTDKIDVSSVKRWSFVSTDKRSAIDISQDRLVYFTSNYPRFQGFSLECEKVLQKVIDIIDPSLLIRIGLRYSDLVTLADNEKFDDLLVDKNFIPTPVTEDIGHTRHLRTENYIQTNTGTLCIRSWFGEMTLTCPPDTENVPVQITRDKEPTVRLLLDFDHIWEAGEESMPFRLDIALERLNSLHEASREAFWKVTSDYARNEKWS